MKEQFIHRLNNNDMLAEVIREFIKAEESTAVTRKQELVRAKGVETQRAQSAIITSQSGTKEFDKIKDNKSETETQSEKTANMCQNAHEGELQLLWFQPSILTMPSLLEEVCEVWQGQPLREVCRCGRNRTVHDLEQEPDQQHEEEDHVDMVNINSIIFSRKQLVVTANLKT